MNLWHGGNAAPADFGEGIEGGFEDGGRGPLMLLFVSEPAPVGGIDVIGVVFLVDEGGVKLHS